MSRRPWRTKNSPPTSAVDKLKMDFNKARTVWITAHLAAINWNQDKIRYAVHTASDKAALKAAIEEFWRIRDDAPQIADVIATIRDTLNPEQKSKFDSRTPRRISSILRRDRWRPGLRAKAR